MFSQDSSYGESNEFGCRTPKYKAQNQIYAKSVENGLKVDINLVTPHLGANDTQVHIPKDVTIVPSTVFVITLEITV